MAKQVGRINMNKTKNIIIRITEQDKEKVRELAELKEMSMSELLTYLVRREYDVTKREF